MLMGLAAVFVVYILSICSHRTTKTHRRSLSIKARLCSSYGSSRSAAHLNPQNPFRGELEYASNFTRGGPESQSFVQVGRKWLWLLWHDSQKMHQLYDKYHSLIHPVSIKNARIHCRGGILFVVDLLLRSVLWNAQQLITQPSSFVTQFDRTIISEIYIVCAVFKVQSKSQSARGVV